MESDVASFIDVGKLSKRSAPENLNVFFLALTKDLCVSVNSVISNEIIR